MNLCADCGEKPCANTGSAFCADRAAPSGAGVSQPKGGPMHAETLYYQAAKPREAVTDARDWLLDC